MVINHENKKNMIQLMDCPKGEVFIREDDNNNVYMLTDECEGAHYLCICLSDGFINRFMGDIVVEIVDAELTIKER